MKRLNIVAFILALIFCFNFVGEALINKSSILKSDAVLMAEGEERNFQTTFRKIVVGSYDELVKALEDESITDIVIGRNLEINETIKISKSVTIDATGYSLVFPSQNNQDNMPAFEISGAKEVYFENLNINGAGIVCDGGEILQLANCQINNSSICAIKSTAKTTIIKNTAISNNQVKEPLIINGGQMIIDASSITENIFFGVETPSSSFIYSPSNTKLYINNTTIAKNITEYNGSAINLKGAESVIINSNILGNVFLFNEENDELQSGALSLEEGANSILLNNVIVGNSQKISNGGFSPCDIYFDEKSSAIGKFNLISTEEKLSTEDNNFINGNLNDFVLTSPASFVKNIKTNNIILSSDFKLPLVVELPNKVKVPVLKGGINLSGGCRTIFDYDHKDNIIVGYIINDDYKLVSGTEEYEMKCVTTVAGGGKRGIGLVGNSFVDPLLSQSLVTVTFLDDEMGTIPQFQNQKEKIVSKGEILVLTASPNEGFEFDSWDIDKNAVEILSKDKDKSSQTIVIKVNGNTTIKPIFKASYSNEKSVILVSDNVSSFVNVDKRDNSFTLSETSISTSDNKTLCGFNTRPDGTGESYLLGKSYKTDKSLVLYAVWCQNGYGYLTGHTEPNSIISLYGRDDFYLGGSNTSDNGDYIITDIIPSFGQRTIIRGSNGDVLQSDIIDTNPVFAKDQKQDELEQEIPNEEDKTSEEQSQEKNEEKKPQPNPKPDKETKPQPQPQKEQPTEQKPQEQQNDQDKSPLVNKILKNLRQYQRNQIFYDWLPDIERNESYIARLKYDYESLTEEELAEISDEDKVEIQNYINAYEELLRRREEANSKADKTQNQSTSEDTSLNDGKGEVIETASSIPKKQEDLDVNDSSQPEEDLELNNSYYD